MYDANVLRHVVDEVEFEDNDQLYTLYTVSFGST